MRVLVVEDERRLAENLSAILREHASWAVDVSADGEDLRHGRVGVGLGYRPGDRGSARGKNRDHLPEGGRNAGDRVVPPGVVAKRGARPAKEGTFQRPTAPGCKMEPERPDTQQTPENKAKAPLSRGQWERQDLNLRRLSRQIYSLLPLTARAHSQHALE